ncbi:MAG: PEP-utilizing enzyme [Candidatus Micrarchaeia archaeon]
MPERLKNQKFIRLTGTAAFPKDTTGEALLLQDFSKKRVGSKFILVAEATYPKYLPIMLKSSGIITELGGILSHAAIVAREFKIPCIIGVKGATSKIKTGDKIIIRKSGVVLVEPARK